MKKTTKIGFVPASRAVFSRQLAVKAREETIQSMKAAGIDVVAPSKNLTPGGLVENFDDAAKTAALFREKKVDGVVIGAMNFGNEIPAATAAIKGAPHAPIFLFGCSEEGELTYESERRDAMCGALSIATALRRRGAKYVFPKVANCDPKSHQLVNELKDFAAVCRMVGGVKGAVYGQIGPRPPEFETCAFDEMALLRKFGVRTVPIPLAEVFDKARGLAAPARIKKTVASFSAFYNVRGVPADALDRLARLEIVLKDCVREHGLDGMAMLCWDGMQRDYGVSCCSVMSRLNQIDGIPVACEVDIHGTFSMHLLSLAAGEPAALMDWNNRHHKRVNVFSAWHCGVYPPSMCDGECSVVPNKIMSKVLGGPEKVYGVVDSQAAPGPVTMTRLTETPGGEWKLLVAEGESVSAPGRPPGGNAWVSVADLDKLYRALLRDFPHHGAIARGRTGRLLTAAAYFLGVEVVSPLPIEGVE